MDVRKLIALAIGASGWTSRRYRRLDKYWVPQTGQGIIYGRILGAVEWTELEGVVGTSDWTELRLVEKGRRYG